MHLSNLLALASALTLAPAVYGYGVATVEVSYAETCSSDEFPRNNVADAELIPATPDSCTQAPSKHSFDIDAYAFKVTAVTKDVGTLCRAVGIYSNTECVGIPETVVPLFPGEKDAQSTCVDDVHFDNGISAKLLCEEEIEHHEPGKPAPPQRGHKGFLTGLGL